MGADKYGYCALCGEYKKMTFEHIPPHGAFNNRKAKIISGDAYINGISKNNFDELRDLPYKEQQKGKGIYSLCAECNNMTGSYYGQAYIDFVQNVAHVMAECKVEKGMTLFIEDAYMKPLSVIKQMISMFCSLNSSAKIDDLRGFVLDKYKTGLGNYRVGLYLFTKGIERFAPMVAGLNMGSSDPILYSEIVSFPLGIILVWGNKTPLPVGCLDISEFANCKYEDEVFVKLSIPVYETNDMMPGIVLK